MNDEEIPEDINVHKQIWGKDADQVNYGSEEKNEDDERAMCYMQFPHR